MKVVDLIAKLQMMPQAAEVFFTFDSGIENPVDAVWAHDGRVLVADEKAEWDHAVLGIESES